MSILHSAPPNPVPAAVDVTAPTTREIVVQALADHHTATISLGGGLTVWACHCGAHSEHGATEYGTAYGDARNHTAQAVLDALTVAGAL